jgi:hypothetical protein
MSPLFDFVDTEDLEAAIPDCGPGSGRFRCEAVGDESVEQQFEQESEMDSDVLRHAVRWNSRPNSFHDFMRITSKLNNLSGICEMPEGRFAWPKELLTNHMRRMCNPGSIFTASPITTQNLQDSANERESPTHHCRILIDIGGIAIYMWNLQNSEDFGSPDDGS